MRKIFIDCGYYRGRAVDLFKKMPEYDSSFEIFAFDPNRIDEVRLGAIRESGINFINKAVWIKDGEIIFHSSGRRHGQANSIFKNPNKIRREKKRSVECIDFSKWIFDNFSKEDLIILKMDIEGAEYQVLNKMIDDGSIHYIKTMFVEYHYNRIEGVNAENFISLKKRLSEETKVDIRKAIEW